MPRYAQLDKLPSGKSKFWAPLTSLGSYFHLFLSWAFLTFLQAHRYVQDIFLSILGSTVILLSKLVDLWHLAHHVATSSNVFVLYIACVYL